jgi:hypothetical protein
MCPELNEPELGTEIDPGMVMIPFPSSIIDKTKFEPTTVSRICKPLDRTDAQLTTFLSGPVVCTVFTKILPSSPD